MDEKYVIGIDQSTQGTKALLFDRDGVLIKRIDKSHEQKINDNFPDESKVLITSNGLISTEIVMEKPITLNTIHYMNDKMLYSIIDIIETKENLNLDKNKKKVKRL